MPDYNLTIDGKKETIHSDHDLSNVDLMGYAGKIRDLRKSQNTSGGPLNSSAPVQGPQRSIEDALSPRASTLPNLSPQFSFPRQGDITSQIRQGLLPVKKQPAYTTDQMAKSRYQGSKKGIPGAAKSSTEGKSLKDLVAPNEAPKTVAMRQLLEKKNLFQSLYDEDALKHALKFGQSEVLDNKGNRHPTQEALKMYESSYGHQPDVQPATDEELASSSYSAGGEAPSHTIGGFENTIKHGGAPFRALQRGVGNAITTATGAQQALAGQPKSASFRNLPIQAQRKANEAIGTGVLNVAGMAAGEPAAIAGFATGSSDPINMLENMGQVAGLHGATKGIEAAIKAFSSHLKESVDTGHLTKQQANESAQQYISHTLKDPDARAVFEKAKETKDLVPKVEAPAPESPEPAPSVTPKPKAARKPKAPKIAPAVPVPETPAPEVTPPVESQAAAPTAAPETSPEPSVPDVSGVEPQTPEASAPEATPAEPSFSPDLEAMGHDIAANHPKPPVRDLTPREALLKLDPDDPRVDEYSPQYDPKIGEAIRKEFGAEFDPNNETETFDILRKAKDQEIQNAEGASGKDVADTREELLNRVGKGKAAREQVAKSKAVQGELKGMGIKAPTPQSGARKYYRTFRSKNGTWQIDRRQPVQMVSLEGLPAWRVKDIQEFVDSHHGTSDKSLLVSEESARAHTPGSTKPPKGALRPGEFVRKQGDHEEAGPLGEQSKNQIPRKLLEDYAKQLTSAKQHEALIKNAKENGLNDAELKHALDHYSGNTEGVHSTPAEGRKDAGVLATDAASQAAETGPKVGPKTDVLTPAQPHLLPEPQSDLELKSPEPPKPKKPTVEAKQGGLDLNETEGLFDESKNPAKKPGRSGTSIPKRSKVGRDPYVGFGGPNKFGAAFKQLNSRDRALLKWEAFKAGGVKEPPSLDEDGKGALDRLYEALGMPGGRTAYTSAETHPDSAIDAIRRLSEDDSNSRGKKIVEDAKAKQAELSKDIAKNQVIGAGIDPEQMVRIGKFAYQMARELGGHVLDHVDNVVKYLNDKFDLKLTPQDVIRSIAHYDEDRGEVPTDAKVAGKPVENVGSKSEASPEKVEKLNTAPKTEPEKPAGKTTTGGKSGTTLANQTQEKHVAEGRINAEPEKGAGKTISELHKEGEDFKDLHEAVNLGSQIRHGMSETEKNFALAAKADQMFHQAVREAERKHVDLMENGGAPHEIAAADEHVKTLREQHQKFLDDVQKGKGHWSNIGRAMQVGRDIENGTLQNVLDRAKSSLNRGRTVPIELPEAERAKFEKDYKDLLAKNEAEKEASEKRHAQAEADLGKTKRRVSYLERYIKGKSGEYEGASREARSNAVREGIRKTREDLRSQIRAEMARSGGGPSRTQSGAVNLPNPKVGILRGQLAKTYIDEGILNATDIAAKMSEFLGEHVSPRDVAKDFDTYAASIERKRVLSEKGRAQQVLRLQGQVEKAADGELSPKAPKPKVADPEIDGLRKRLSDLTAKPKATQTEKDLATMQRLRDKIRDLQKNGPPSETPKQITPEEIRSLRRKVRELSKRAPEDPVADRYLSALRKATKALDDLQSGKERTKGVMPEAVTAKAKAAKASLEDAREQLASLRKSKGFEKRLADLEAQAKMSDKDFLEHRTALDTKRWVDQYNASKDIEGQQRINEARAKIEKRIEDLRPKTPGEKAASVLRNSVLASFPVIEKLVGASTWRGAVGPLEDLFANVTEKLPGGGGKSLGQLAKSESKGGVIPRIQGTLSKEALRNAKSQVATASDAIDRAKGISGHGRPNEVRLNPFNPASKTVDLAKATPGRWHGFEKAFIKTGEYKAALSRVLRDAMPEQLKDPDWLRSAAWQASATAQEAILRGDNHVSDAVGNWIEGMLRSSHGGNQALGALATAAAPVRKVAFNFAKQASDYTGLGGLARGAGLHAYETAKAGGMAMSPEAAAEIQRAYKRGGAGLVAMYLGLANPALFESGGYYTPGVKRSGKDLQPGEFRVAGHVLPAILAHSPFASAIQFWASVRMAMKRGEGFERSMGRGAMGMGDLVPAMSDIRRDTEDISQGRAGKVLGEKASEFLPAPIGRGAKAMDLQPGSGSPLGYLFGGPGKPNPRKAESLIPAVQQNIPGARNLLPPKTAGSSGRGGRRSAGRRR